METKILKNQRDLLIDSLKGVLILLVILGHCVGHDRSYYINLTIYNYIYLFHMPMFVLMSGYFTHDRGSKKFWHRLLSFVFIYVFWQIVKSLYLGRSLKTMVILPAPMMWYLLSLFIWCFVYWLAGKINKHLSPKVLMIIGLSVSLFAGFFPQIGAPFALSRTLFFAPFFFLGVALQKTDVFNVIKRTPGWTAWLVLVFVFIGLLFSKKDISSIVRGVSSYSVDSPLLGFICRTAYYCVAIVMSCALTRVILPTKLMVVIGRETMKYYIFHGVILMVLYNLPVPWSLGYAVLYWIIIAFALYFFNKFKFSDVVLNPIGKIVESVFK